MLGQEMGHRLYRCVPDYVVFDLETTGISPAFDAVIEMSGIRVRNRQPVEEFTSLIHPGRPIPAGASMVNGITDEMVADAPPLETVLRNFMDFIGDDVLAGHNIHSFDMKFLYRDCRRVLNAIPGNDYIDTLSLARGALPELPHHRLTDLAAHYHISTRGAHRALQDCRMNQAVLECLREELGKKEGVAERDEICPVCGSLLVRRKGRFGEFYGCTAFPACRFTKNCRP